MTDEIAFRLDEPIIDLKTTDFVDMRARCTHEDCVEGVMLIPRVQERGFAISKTGMCCYACGQRYQIVDDLDGWELEAKMRGLEDNAG